MLEQGTGIEPAFTAWEAVVLPIYEPCVWGYYTRAKWKFQPFFVEKFLFSVRHSRTIVPPAEGHIFPSVSFGKIRKIFLFSKNTC